MKYKALKILFYTGGCFFSGCNIDKPPPPLFKVWHKWGASDAEVLLSLKECKFTDKEIYNIDIATQDSANAYAAAQICMQNKGYRNRGFTDCDYDKHLPACVNYKR